MKTFSTPKIIRQTYHGFDSYAIADEMLSRREISCSDEITVDTVDSLIFQMLYLAHEDPKSEITFYINSPGGEVSSGLALYDVMKAISCPIRTICVGMAASMAAVLFASGDTRDMLPHARLMIHDPSMSGVGGSAMQLHSLSEDLLRTREILCRILAEDTGKTLEEIYVKTQTDTYFYADEAIAFGLADNIISTI